MAACAIGPREPAAKQLAAQLNEACHCVTIDRRALEAALSAASGDPDFYATHFHSRPHLVSDTAVFLARRDAAAMMDIVTAVEAVVQLPQYREAALAYAPASARAFFGQRGAFMGYDFHVADDGPKLIEINTNAGGAFLNALFTRAQSAPCAAQSDAPEATAFDDAVVAQFESEWRAQFGDAPLRRIAIVDDAPQSQYLYPEFLLARALLERRGFEVTVTDAAALQFADGALAAEGRRVDLVYNRLVDFALDDPAHAALRTAYLAGAVAVTPNPRNHALHADKRNLALLSDDDLLRSWGVGAAHRTRLAQSLKTVAVDEANADALWAARRELFFKPAAGYGGKAVYRGGKLTRGVWPTIAAGGYVAQTYAPPSARSVMVDGAPTRLKLDVRLYAFDGRMMLAAARLYQGQTTNFRTPGGGFAPVVLV